MPRPSQAGQAPKGLLNENRRGSISSMVKPETGQANLAEKVVRSPVLAPVLAPLLAFPDFASSAKARPSARWSAVSKLSARRVRSEEHTSELQSLMRISYAVFCLQTKNSSIT